MEHAELSCGELLKRLNDLMKKRANQEFQEQDITFSQVKMLVRLYEMPEREMTLKELERYFGAAQATIAGIAVRLEKKGLIEGFADAEDKRIKHVRLTEAGYQLCLKMQAHMEESEQKFLAPLDETEQRELHRLLQKVYDWFR